MNMTSLCEFWRLQLEEYNSERLSSLPADRHRLSSDQRSGFASLVDMSFDDESATAFLDYASLHPFTPFQLGLAIFHAFLFKLTHGQNDLCCSSLNAERDRTELETLIGMFVAKLSYRIQLYSHWSFDELVKHVCEKCLSILETAFDLATVSLNVNQLSFDGVTAEKMPLKETSVVTKFDLMLTFVYNLTLNDRRLSFRLVGAHDLFEETTLATIAQRPKHLF